MLCACAAGRAVRRAVLGLASPPAPLPPPNVALGATHRHQLCVLCVGWRQAMGPSVTTTGAAHNVQSARWLQGPALGQAGVSRRHVGAVGVHCCWGAAVVELVCLFVCVCVSVWMAAGSCCSPLTAGGAFTRGSGSVWPLQPPLMYPCTTGAYPPFYWCAASAAWC